MKELLITLVVIIAIIGAGIGISALTHFNYLDGVASASVHGYEEGFDQGYEDGLKEGSEDGYQEGSRVQYAKVEGIDSASDDLSEYYFLYNPSYEEVMDFLDVEELETFTEIQSYAVAHGIRTGYVRCYVAMNIPRQKTYIYDLVAFDTVDMGLVVIEPWSHRAVVVAAGEIYRGLLDQPEAGIEGIVSKVTILW